MQVVFIQTEETFPLRQKVLKPNSELSACYLPKDNDTDTFHLAVKENNEIIAIGTFNKSNLNFFKEENQYNLKGMATCKDYQGKNVGTMLMEFAISHLSSKGVTLLWCNARVSSMGFYEKMGFKPIGDVFEIGQAGLHQTMFIEL
jgi:GNAT superfamily N-acetyltransferase